MGFSTNSPSATTGGGQTNSPVRFHSVPRAYGIFNGHVRFCFSFIFLSLIELFNVQIQIRQLLSAVNYLAKCGLGLFRQPYFPNQLVVSAQSNFPNPLSHDSELSSSPQSQWPRWLTMTAILYSPHVKTVPRRRRRSGDAMRSARSFAMPAVCSSSCMVDLGR